MSFEEKIKEFTKPIEEKIKHISSEETTKLALIFPFVRLMGYDTENPAVVQAEYTADIGSKQGEKIDLAILTNGEVEILIECKTVNNPLDEKNISQLYRYFNITHSKIGILTNGVIYKFFTDSTNPGKMDNNPFLELNLLDLSKKDIIELEKFTIDNYNLDNILARVDVLKYTKDIKNCLNSEIEVPSEEFVKVIGKQVYDGVLTKKTRDLFKKIIQSVFKEVIDDKVNKRLKEAISEANREVKTPITIKEPDIITNPSELEGYYIIRSILSEIIDNERVSMRDRKSYCGILLDDHKAYPICRLYFNNENNLSVGFFDKFKITDKGSKVEDKVNIGAVKDLYHYKDRINKTVITYNRIKK